MIFYLGRFDKKMLLTKATRLIENNNGTDYGFTSIYCSLKFRYKNGSFRYLNSENKLQNFINAIYVK